MKCPLDPAPLSEGIKATVALVAAIALSGCATYSEETLAATPAGSSSLAGEDKIRPHCEEEWPGDWSSIAFCVRRRTEGFREVERFVEGHDIRDGDTTPEADIFAKCSREWQSIKGHPDWSAIAFCIRRQWEGYKELNP